MTISDFNAGDGSAPGLSTAALRRSTDVHECIAILRHAIASDSRIDWHNVGGDSALAIAAREVLPSSSSEPPARQQQNPVTASATTAGSAAPMRLLLRAGTLNVDAVATSKGSMRSHDYTYAGVMRTFEAASKATGCMQFDTLLLEQLDLVTHTQAEYDEHLRHALSGGYRAAMELQRDGHIHHIGMAVEDADACIRLLDEAHWHVCVLGSRYTLMEHWSLEDALPRCAETSTPIIIASPYNTGILAGGSRWNHREAPNFIKARANNIHAVCQQHAIPIGAAALQFPLAHPQVQDVLAGAASHAQRQQQQHWWQQSLPEALWTDLKSSGVMRADAPTPGGPDGVSRFADQPEAGRWHRLLALDTPLPGVFDDDGQQPTLH